MTTLSRYEVVWDGLSGLPGLSVFYSLAAVDATASIKAFFTSVLGVFPAPLTWTVPSSGDTIDETTGTLVGAWTGAGGGSVAAGNAGPHAAGTGTFVTWETAAVLDGRRLKGRTFLCPLNNSSYDASGTILAATNTTLQTAANTLVATGNLRIWHRPQGGPNGIGVVPVAASLPDRVTSLKTRRR